MSNMSEKGFISKPAFKKMLYQYVENKILDHKRRLRNRQLNEINFKLYSDCRYREKNEFFEF